MSKTLRASGCLWILLAFLLSACGAATSTVSGDVTYEGQPVENGEINFLPADGKGAPAGTKIVGGKYEVQGLVPGPKVVQITAVKSVPFARSHDEMAKRHKAAKARGDGTGIIDPADIIPADAEGNNATIELQPGSQTQDFSLKKPAKQKT